MKKPRKGLVVSLALSIIFTSFIVLFPGKPIANHPTKGRLETETANGKEAAVEVKAIANNLETKVSGLRLWLDAASLQGQTDGVPINSSWRDKADGQLLAEAITGHEPKFIADAVNGRPALRFNGAGESLAVSLPTAGDATVIAVFANRSIEPSTYDQTVSSADVVVSTSDSGDKLVVASSRSGEDRDYPGVYVSVGGNPTESYINGRSSRDAGHETLSGRFVVASAVVSGLPSSKHFFIGSRNASSGYGKNDIAEVLFYDRKLSNTERETIEADLGKKYGIDVLERDLQHPVEMYNYMLGTQQIGKTYDFGESPYRVVNAARSIYKLGSRIMKFTLSSNYSKQNGIPINRDIKNLAELAAYEPIKQVLDMPFTDYLFWTSPLSAKGSNAWRKTDQSKEPPQEEWDHQYREMYDLTRYLLETYQNTGKTFYLGNWEGDWTLFGGLGSEALKHDPPDARIADMIKWANIRQKAVDDAKADFKMENAGLKGVQVYYYVELNQALFAIQGRKCVANSVLPGLEKLDYVSISSYSIQKQDQETINKVFAHINHILLNQPRQPDDVQGSRIMIGEFGFPQNKLTPAQQAALDREAFVKYTKAGAKFVLIWQFYNNESEQKMHALIGPHNEVRPRYKLLEEYYRKAKSYVADYYRVNGDLPPDEDFREKAVEILNGVNLED